MKIDALVIAHRGDGACERLARKLRRYDGSTLKTRIADAVIALRGDGRRGRRARKRRPYENAATPGGEADQHEAPLRDR